MWRSKDQRLWNEFRAHIDPLFEQLTEQRTQQKVQVAEQKQQFVQLCEQAESLSGSSDGPIEEQTSQFRSLQSEWRAQGGTRSDLATRFDAATQQFEAQRTERMKIEANQARLAWREKLKLCVQLESDLGGASKPEQLLKKSTLAWPEGGHEASDVFLQARLQSITEQWNKDNELKRPPEQLAQNLDFARQFCLEAEFLAGLDSPASEREARMAFQVQRLSRTLSDSTARLPVLEELQELEDRWYALGSIEAKKFVKLERRFSRAI